MDRETQRKLRGFAILAAVYAFVAFVIPRPESVDPAGWRLTAIFLTTIAGSILEPVPAGALVLTAVTLAALMGGLTMSEALGGYANTSVWLVLAAFFISRALIGTGLARRVALQFVRVFGRNSLGVAYSLAASDFVMAGMIPSNAARSGGVVMPIARSIAELYESRPGATAGRLGAYLMAGTYQSICVTAAMFYTGQASNPLAAEIASDFGYPVSWLSWFRVAIVPGLLSLAIVPWLALRVMRPTVQRTPEARAFAAGELDKLGPMRREEWIVAGVFVGVCALWISSTWSGVNITVTALLGVIALLFTGVLKWEDIPAEKAGWAIFIWYGGLLRLAQGLNDAGVTTAFADAVAGFLGGYGWPALFAITIVIYFYAHYAFASITAHIVSMFPPFLAVLLAAGAPAGLAVYAFACLANLAAGLTHYGTTPAPIFFAQGYVGLEKWWKLGALASVVNLAIWTTAGFAWWKLTGVW